MNFHKVFLMFVSLGAGLAFGADVITVNLDFATFTVAPGITVDVTGTIVKNTSDYVYLNSIAIEGLPAGLSVDPSPFLNAPYPLNPNQTSDDFTFFSVTSPDSYAGPFGMLTATVTILGDSSPFPTIDSAENPITVTSLTVDAPGPVDTQTPEPATPLFFAIGLLLVFAARWKSGARVRQVGARI